MFYEVFLVLFGVYIEQTYHLPSFNAMINQFKTQNNSNFMYNFLYYLKKKMN